MQVHKTAVISKEAKLGEDVVIGPYAVISGKAVIGAGSKLASHCVVEGNTTIGKNCEIFTGAVIGSRPQDLKYKGEKVYLEVGDNNIIREYCTLNPGTEEGSKTIVGSGNLIMAYSHVAHDCRVGDNCVLANGSTLAGHVTIEDRAVIGGLVAIHQFVRVGKLSIIGGCSKVVQDIPPYSTCDGHPAAVFGLNLIGLRRHNVPKESIGLLDDAFRILFSSGLSVKHSLEKLVQEVKLTSEVTYLVEFIKKTERGIARSCRK
ncbi:MAG: acyl-ACP--UDP-N-acetylglucosamine O-acyltransferase [Candidatus Omnitrophota bacterium]